MYTLHIECVTGRCNHGRTDSSLMSKVNGSRATLTRYFLTATTTCMHTHSYCLVWYCYEICWHSRILCHPLKWVRILWMNYYKPKPRCQFCWTFWLIETASIVFIDAINIRSSFTRNYLDRHVTWPIRAGRGWVTRCSSVACALIPSALVTRALTSAAVIPRWSFCFFTPLFVMIRPIDKRSLRNRARSPVVTGLITVRTVSQYRTHIHTVARVQLWRCEPPTFWLSRVWLRDVHHHIALLATAYTDNRWLSRMREITINIVILLHES